MMFPKPKIIVTATAISCFMLQSCWKLSAPHAERPEVDKTCLIDIDTVDFSYGVDHEDPQRYVIPGPQSDLHDTCYQQVTSSLGEIPLTIAGMLNLCSWVHENFAFSNAGGTMIGVHDVNQLFTQKTFYGCHSQALIISSILRRRGFPVIMIETAGVDWAMQFHANETNTFSGHVMSEVFVDSAWVLLDNNGSFVRHYDPENPFISMQAWHEDDFFVYAKGVDTWSYSGLSQDFTHEKMRWFAEHVYCFEDRFNTVDYTWSD